jgi:hypothetical protein
VNFDRPNRALYCVGLVTLELRWATRTVNLLNCIQLVSQRALVLWNSGDSCGDEVT